MSYTDRRVRAYNLNEALKARLELNIALVEAERSRRMTDLAASETWAKDLDPMFEEDVRNFLEAVWSCNRDTFELLRAQALRSRDNRDYVLTRVGQRDKFLADADLASGRLRKLMTDHEITDEELDAFAAKTPTRAG